MWVQQDAERTFQIEDTEINPLVSDCCERAEKKAKQKAALEEERAIIEKEKEERRIARKQRAEERANRPKAESKNLGRRIGRYNDDMLLLEEYDSVTSSSKAVGISPKSIRDAASGKQKHAAGYVWKYIDADNNDE